MVFLICLLIGSEKREDVKKELKRFQGEWVLVKAEVNGKAVPDLVDKGKNFIIVIRGNKSWFEDRDNSSGDVIPSEVTTFTISPMKKPKQIDITFVEEEERFRRNVGIYEFQGDKLKICYTPAGGKRPKRFSSKEGTEKNAIFLGIYKRVKKGN
jgi:uncharacterized protein (TIGR03067 family)